MDLKVISYNPTGFNVEKANFIKFLLNTLDIDILLIQEHMHLRQNIFKIQRELNEFESFFLPAVKNSNNISAGRPSGGICIFWKPSLNKIVNMIKHPNSSRVQGIELGNNLILNTYFPVDPRVATFNDFELLKCIEDIKWYFDNFCDHNIIIAGDLNTDLSRNTRFVNTVRELLYDFNLVSVWSNFGVDFTFMNSQVRDGNNILATSVIDHFIVHQNGLNSIKEAQAIHLGDNLSCHEPIYMCINIDITVDNSTTVIPSADRSNVSTPNWRKASQDNLSSYRHDLSSKLNNCNFTPGISCNNPMCSNSDHHHNIDEYCEFVLNSIDSSVNSHIPPCNAHANKHVKPGWSEFVKPYRDDARFWYSIWLSLGKPLNCEIHNVMKHTRNVYHYAVRRIKKNEAQIKQDNMFNSLTEHKVPNLIKQLKSQRSGYKSVNASKIDGICEPVNIANHFADIYSDLYNRNNSSDNLKVVLDRLNVNVNSMTDVELVTPQLVYQAISKLKSEKSDSNFCWKSNAFLVASDILANHLSILIQCFLIHGYIPSSLLSCSLKPIVKNNLTSKFSSDNYRAIGISSLILKVLDWVILILYESELKPSEFQFGFQKKNSTTMCSWVVSETVNFFNNRNTPVFTCFLDLTKAFDLVNFSKLFDKLSVKISPVFVRLIAYIYVNQICVVQWAGVKSKSFKVANGVRQGAVLSPTLFSLYIDELYVKLLKSGFGCHINDLYYGIFGYADDLVLLSPDRSGLQNMLDITSDFLSSLGLKISVNHDNPSKSKTKCVAFGTKASPAKILLNGVSLPWSDSFNHLGHLIYKDGTFNLDFENKRKSFVGEFHALRQELGPQTPVVLLNLIQVYLFSFYGSNLWDLFNCESIYTTWNIVIRDIFQLPKCTHRYFIEPISETPHLFTVLVNRFIKFYKNLCVSDKMLIQNLRTIQEIDTRSTFGSNLRNICLSTGCDLLNISDAKNEVKYQNISNLNVWRVSVLKELLDSRNSNIDTFFNASEIHNLIDYIACY